MSEIFAYCPVCNCKADVIESIESFIQCPECKNSTDTYTCLSGAIYDAIMYKEFTFHQGEIKPKA